MAGLGDYELQSQIGVGASGTVWLALRPGPVPQVAAVKRLRAGVARADGLARLRAEAAVLTELDHPHVVRVLEVVPDGDGVAICMQYAPGGSLAQVLSARGRLAPDETVAVAVPIAEALASAHRRGVVHGDVKPANVLFTSDGEPLLGDFGVARTLGQLPGDPGPVSGTAAYLAPELLDGAAPDPRSDVYSLAVVCYESLTGRVPYDGPTPDAVVAAARRGGHEPLTARRSVPGPLATVVEQALARDPAERVATADLLARGLRAALPPGQVALPPVVASPVDPGTPGGPPDLGGPGHAGDPGSHGGLAPAGEPGGPRDAGDMGRDGGEDPRLATRTFGPRPPRPEPEPPRRRARLPLRLVAALAAAGAVYLVRGPLGGEESCPEVHEPVVEVGAQVVAGDPEGDGCEAYGVYQLRTLDRGEEAMVLTMPVDGERQGIRLGEPGDQVLLGDWDCDGRDTPGLYRRARGEVRRFDTWPEVEDRRYEPTEIEPAPPLGRAAVVPGDGADEGDGEGDPGGEGDGGDRGTGGEGEPGGSGGGAVDHQGGRGRCDRIRVRTGTAT